MSITTEFICTCNFGISRLAVEAQPETPLLTQTLLSTIILVTHNIEETIYVWIARALHQKSGGDAARPALRAAGCTDAILHEKGDRVHLGDRAAHGALCDQQHRGGDLSGKPFHSWQGKLTGCSRLESRS